MEIQFFNRTFWKPEFPNNVHIVLNLNKNSLENLTFPMKWIFQASASSGDIRYSAFIIFPIKKKTNQETEAKVLQLKCDGGYVLTRWLRSCRSRCNPRAQIWCWKGFSIYCVNENAFDLPELKRPILRAVLSIWEYCYRRRGCVTYRITMR